MKSVLISLNLIVSIIVIFLILIQGRGAGLGSAWGGGGEMFQTKRGLEKIVLRMTVLLVVVFFILAVINFILR
jgi:preprotein translocase subunit SecG